MLQSIRIARALMLLVAAGALFMFARYFVEMRQSAGVAPTTAGRTRHGGSSLPMRVGSAELAVNLAETPIEQARGLSGRADLGENEGMLFVFHQADTYAFWMKNMRFPIDILWVGPESAVIGVTPNVQPDSFPERFTPSIPARYVLEVNAGWAERHGVQTGTSVTLPETGR